MKHTKGPWVYNSGTQGEIQDADGDLVLQIKPQNRGHDEAEANARLIAAAPELFHALKGVMDLIESGYLVRNVDDDAKPGWALKQVRPVGMLKMAIDAIAKAEGRS